MHTLVSEMFALNIFVMSPYLRQFPLFPNIIMCNVAVDLLKIFVFIKENLFMHFPAFITKSQRNIRMFNSH